MFRLSKRYLEWGLLLIFLVAGAQDLWAAQPIPTDAKGRPLYQSGVVAVKLSADTAPAALKALPHRFGIPTLDAVADDLEVVKVEQMIQSRFTKARPDLPDLSRIYRVSIPETVDVRRAARLFANDPLVEYAEPVPFHYADETPDDPEFNRQWFLESIEAEAAWDVHKGEDGAVVVVGISDSGVAWRHEDLVDNIYQNLGEDADGDGKVIEESGGTWVFDPDDVNNFDDDGNGYADDFVGWDFYNEAEGQDNDPDDPGSHGTHVAGLASATTDNATGIASVSWNVKILPTSATNEGSEDTLQRTLSTVVYLAENGADIINMSWGNTTTSQFEQDVLDYASGLGSLLVASAGNDSTSDIHFPSASPGVISVASVGKTDRLASYSNFGISIDVTSPGGAGGNQMRSTIPPSNYGYKVGTSMASPVVAGAFAFVKSLHPSWNNDQLVEQLLGTADSVEDLNQNYAGLLGEGRINTFRAVTDQPTTSTPELRLDIWGMQVIDDSGDGSLEPGEGAEIRVTLRNYSHIAASNSVTLTLQSESPSVEVIGGTVTTSVTKDMLAEVASTFSIQVAADAGSELVTLTLSAEASGATVSTESTLDLPQLLIAGGGLLVWEGVADGPTFSGRYLYDELVTRGFDAIYVSGDFPSGLVGFDGVFLSFGNAGLDSDGPPFSARLDAQWKSDAIQDFLESGGKLYLEGGDTLGWDAYNMVDGEDLIPLFGLEIAVDGTTNEIDSLGGHDGTLTEGMNFAESTQTPVEWIDIFTPSSGTEAFAESGYGVVAVQNVGQYGQRTFCFAYALAELTDGATTRTELVDALVEFFDFGSTVGVPSRIRRPSGRVLPAAEGKRLPTASGFD